MMRPTVINCYDGDLGTVDAWWAQWKDFIFKKEVTVNGRNGVETKLVQKMLSPIKHSKYPAITEEEMRWWLEYMAATGRADFVWMALRAFGFDGRGDEMQEEGAH